MMPSFWPFVDEKPFIIMRLIMLAGLLFLLGLTLYAFLTW